MAITQVKGTYHNMPVIFHQEDGKTVKITPGSFCPRCQETRYRIIDEGFIECYTCGRSYFVPSQEQIDAVVIAPERQEDAILPIKLKQITISLEPHAKATDLIWELEQLFPRKELPLQ